MAASLPLERDEWQPHSRAMNGRLARAAAGHVSLFRFASRGHSATGGRALLPALPEACCPMLMTGVVLPYALDLLSSILLDLLSSILLSS